MKAHRGYGAPKEVFTLIIIIIILVIIKVIIITVGQAVACAPVTQRAQIQSLVGPSFLGEVF